MERKFKIRKKSENATVRGAEVGVEVKVRKELHVVKAPPPDLTNSQVVNSSNLIISFQNYRKL